MYTGCIKYLVKEKSAFKSITKNFVGFRSETIQFFSDKIITKTKYFVEMIN